MRTKKRIYQMCFKESAKNKFHAWLYYIAQEILERFFFQRASKELHKNCEYF